MDPVDLTGADLCLRIAQHSTERFVHVVELPVHVSPGDPDDARVDQSGEARLVLPRVRFRAFALREVDRDPNPGARGVAFQDGGSSENRYSMPAPVDQLLLPGHRDALGRQLGARGLVRAAPLGRREVVPGDAPRDELLARVAEHANASLVDLGDSPGRVSDADEDEPGVPKGPEPSFARTECVFGPPPCCTDLLLAHLPLDGRDQVA